MPPATDGNTASISPSTLPASVPAALTAGILAVSSGAILIRYAQAEGMPSLMIAAGRMGIATLMLTPVTLMRYRPFLAQLSRADLSLAALAGLFLALHFATWVTSLEHTSVLVSVVMVTTTPLWVVLLEKVFLKAQISRQTVTGLMIAIAGGILISIPNGDTGAALESPNTLLGAGLALAGAITASVYLVIGRKLRAQTPLIPYIWLVYGIAAIILLMSVLAMGIPVTGYPTFSYGWLVLLAIFPQLIGHSSLNYAVAYIPATMVSVINQLEPIGSALLALILFNELPGTAQLVGSVIILAGVLIASIRRSGKPIA